MSEENLRNASLPQVERAFDASVFSEIADPEHVLVRPRWSDAAMGMQPSALVAPSPVVSAIPLYKTVPARLSYGTSPISTIIYVVGRIYSDILLLRIPRLYLAFSSDVLLARRGAMGPLFDGDQVRFANSQKNLRNVIADGLEKLAMEWSKICSYSVAVLTAPFLLTTLSKCTTYNLSLLQSALVRLCLVTGFNSVAVATIYHTIAIAVLGFNASDAARVSCTLAGITARRAESYFTEPSIFFSVPAASLSWSIITTILLFIVSTFSLFNHVHLAVDVSSPAAPHASLLTNVLVDRFVLGYAVVLIAHTLWSVYQFANTCLRPRSWSDREDIEGGEFTMDFARRALTV